MFENCSAPACPLDKFSSERVHLKEDSICPYCRNYKKQGTRLSMPEELKRIVPKKNRNLLSWKNR